MVELNWFQVLDSGDGSPAFMDQAGGGVPGIVEFEGNDFFNFGAANADQNRSLVTAAIGFRSRISDSIQSGVAYEMPLTEAENSVIDGRLTLTLDLVWRF